MLAGELLPEKRKKLEREEKTRRKKVEDTMQKKSMEAWMNLKKEGNKRGKLDSTKVEYAEKNQQVPERGERGVQTLRERTAIFGETVSEKLERDRNKRKIEKKAKEKEERGKRVTEKRDMFERGG